MKLRNQPKFYAAVIALTALLISACGAGNTDSATIEQGQSESSSTVGEETAHETDDEYYGAHAGMGEPLSEEHLADGVEMTDCIAERENIFVEPGTVMTEDDLASMCPDNEVLTECTDAAALEANADHEPAGWPQEWSAGDPMPDPECHPDFIEVYAWDQFDTFFACWEGPETGTMVRTPSMTDQDVFSAEWESSRSRAHWEQPTLETWDDMGITPAEASPECAATYEDQES